MYSFFISDLILIQLHGFNHLSVSLYMGYKPPPTIISSLPVLWVGQLGWVQLGSSVDLFWNYLCSWPAGIEAGWSYEAQVWWSTKTPPAPPGDLLRLGCTVAESENGNCQLGIHVMSLLLHHWPKQITRPAQI